VVLHSVERHTARVSDLDERGTKERGLIVLQKLFAPAIEQRVRPLIAMEQFSSG
jgi:hypothetical protein